MYEDLHRPLTRLDTAVGYSRDEIKLEVITYEQMRPGSFSVPERLADMDVNHVQSALCFPTFPRSAARPSPRPRTANWGCSVCGRTTTGWSRSGAARSGGRLIPLTLIPLWDAELAAAEVRRNAARGVRAVAFSEIPRTSACPPSTRTNGTPSCRVRRDRDGLAMHIGSSRMPSTSADAPPAVGSTITFANCCFSMVDWLMSGKFERFPNLRIMYAEGQIGWIPYILERADVVWEENRGWGGVADKVHRPPSELFAEHVYGCFFDDAFGLRNLDAIGVGNVLYETDYPHSDSTWPKSREVGEAQMGHLAPDVVDRIVRGNAIELLGLTKEGLWAGLRAGGGCVRVRVRGASRAVPRAPEKQGLRPVLFGPQGRSPASGRGELRDQPPPDPRCGGRRGAAPGMGDLPLERSRSGEGRVRAAGAQKPGMSAAATPARANTARSSSPAVPSTIPRSSRAGRRRTSRAPAKPAGGRADQHGGHEKRARSTSEANRNSSGGD